MAWQLLRADARRIPLADGSVHCCVTSPPYWGLRSYLDASDPRKRHELGAEPTPAEYVANMVEVFAEVWRVMRDDGCLFLNLGDTYSGGGGGNYGNGKSVMSQGGQQVTNVRNRPAFMENAGLKPKDLAGIPWRTALALQEWGWYLRSASPWVKRAAMPESVTDRPASAVEYVFVLTKRPRYFWDAEAVRRSSAGSTIERDKHTRITKGKDGPYAVQHDHETPSHPGGRHWRNADLWFESVGMLLSGDEPVGFDVSPQNFDGAHFATMPARLVLPCVLAATSERGCCPACGAPWERVVERGEDVPQTGRRQRLALAALTKSTKTGGIARSTLGAGSGGDTHGRVSRTLDWQPTCPHDLPPVPCRVFDPFAGAGTTAMVANQLGRDAIGCDISGDYLAMADARIAAALKPVSRLDAPRTVKPLAGQMEFAL